jgi:hypothetical protein
MDIENIMSQYSELQRIRENPNEYDREWRVYKDRKHKQSIKKLYHEQKYKWGKPDNHSSTLRQRFLKGVSNITRIPRKKLGVDLYSDMPTYNRYKLHYEEDPLTDEEDSNAEHKTRYSINEEKMDKDELRRLGIIGGNKTKNKTKRKIKHRATNV